MNEKVTTYIEEPNTCPCCEYLLEKVNDQLFCRNIACPAQTAKKVEHFCKVLGIKGMGPKTVEKLGIAEITEIFYLDRDEAAQILGDKLADKLLDEIERSKSSTLEVVLASFSIPLIGSTAAAKLAAVINSIGELSEETCKKAGLGAKATENVLEWYNRDYLELKEFLPFSFKSVPKVISALGSVCITGKLKSVKKKAEAEDLLKAAGFEVVESVTKDTKYLLDEGNAGSAKREKAEKYGIPIVTDLNDLLNKTKV